MLYLAIEYDIENIRYAIEDNKNAHAALFKSAKHHF